MSQKAQQTAEPRKIPFRMHPRVFESLGADLVTSDVVAIIELVKNSYDAHATRVDVRLKGHGEDGKLMLEIEDNGLGMTREVIEDAWAVVATPFRVTQISSKQGRKGRRVSGAKGLGRLSAARLGNKLEMFTKSASESCWRVKVDWETLAASDDLSSCKIELGRYDSDALAGRTGTLIRIQELKSNWDGKKIIELREQLSRLISPFTRVEDFEIWLTYPGDDDAEPVEIEPVEFLSKPPYLLKGSVDKFGKVSCTYTYAPLQGANRTVEIIRDLWTSDFAPADDDQENGQMPQCGPFKFEVRVWDLDKDAETFKEISEEFNLNLATLRKNIKSYQGLSLYRDEILVLPKSESAKDWLGLDLRSVSKPGARIRTSQIVGYLSLTAKSNPNIVDTSDRERLADNPASRDFKKLLWAIVAILENERGKDRQVRKERPFKELFAALSTHPLIERMEAAVAKGIEAKDLLPLVEKHGTEVDKAVEEIEKRFIYYSRLASLGTLAAILTHEVGQNTLVIGGLTRAVGKLIEKGDPAVLEIERDWELADRSVRALDRLAKKMTPLASRRFGAKRRDSVLEEEIRYCLDAHEEEIRNKKVEIYYHADAKTKVAIDPGELFGIINNLLDNSLYWLGYVKDRPRRIEVQISPRTQTGRVYVRIHDSGPGIPDGDEERIFWPGVTQKPEGFGMGLVVASELVAKHDGRLYLIKPGKLEGASFGFDLPFVEHTK